jgi:phenylpropionate dioxygenase-like ring-hydroxylating dioxygenase large terminal subunit
MKSLQDMVRELSQPGDPSLAPGEARCPGPTIAELLAAEGSARDPGLAAQRYRFLGNADLPFSRYTDPAFHEAEIERMWPKVWQWACREEHLPDPGDFQVYDVGPYSALVIRGEDRAIRSFVNACPHRGMQFADAGASGTGKQFIRCPFHGMSWNLDGSLQEIPCRWDFPHVEDDSFGLTEIPTDTWAGFVFINFDADCAPLTDYLEVLPEHFSRWGLENRFVAMHTRKVLPGNWKMCMEAFLEAFHVLATHPEGLRSSSWANTQYDIFGANVSRFLQGLATGNPHLEQSEKEKYASLGYDPDSLPEGISARRQHAENMRASMGETFGADLSEVNTSLMLDSIEYHLFPNACFFPGIQIPLIYRFRPIGYDQCLHEILLLQPLPDDGPRPAPAVPIDLDMGTSYTTVEGFPLARVLDQDTENFHRQWAGMQASLKQGQTLGNYQEARIRNLHNTLDTYLSQPSESQQSEA